MTLSIRKIEHRGAIRIGIYFEKNYTVQLQLKSIGAVYSKTFACWYIDYTKQAYQQLKNLFPNLYIEQQVAGKKRSRDLPPIAKSELQLGLSSTVNKPEHITINDLLAQKLRLELLPNIGKYWVFRIRYIESVVNQLKSVKGVYWHSTHKVYMGMRNPKVKEAIERILEVKNFFPNDYLEKEVVFEGKSIVLRPHKEDVKWMQVYVPNILTLLEKIKRISMVRYSKPNRCFILPSTPTIYEALISHFEPHRVIIQSELPDGYISKRNEIKKKLI